MKFITVFGVLATLPFLVNCLLEDLAGNSSPVTTTSLIKAAGYPVEEHEVQTEDGYILTMHRIPYSKESGNNGKQRPIALLMHGLFGSSSDWVLGGPDGPGAGLAYRLSIAGYDVWMGNARGNTYSRKHISKNPMIPSFWNFGWHEIAKYDLTAMTNYMLKSTGEKVLRYFGYSQGTTVFIVACTIVEGFNQIIHTAHLLAPIIYMGDMKSALSNIGAPLLGLPNPTPEITASFEFLPSNEILQQLGFLTCKANGISLEICRNMLFLVFGNSPRLNKTMVPAILHTTPAGSSIRQVIHYEQEHESGFFREFDYGFIRNLIEYDSIAPPDYNLTKINCLLHIYYGENDDFAATSDVDRAIRILGPRLKNAYKVPDPEWGHLDFLWGSDVNKKVYDEVMNDVNNS